jgi:(4S)-4-hydroxy-5-phosphonooxypentane-2,3-dione isomerase
MSEKPIYVFAKWQVKEGQFDTVLKLVAELARESTAEEGNLFYKAFQSNNDANTIMMHEGYKGQSAADTHRQSAHYQDGIAKIIPLLKEREVVLTSALDFAEIDPANEA